MSHPFPADLLLCHLYAAPVADDSAVTDSLIFPAIALVVLRRAEDFLAEKSVSLRLVCPVVHGLRLQNLSARPRDDVLRGGQRDAYCLEVALYLIFFIAESRHIYQISKFLNILIQRYLET